MPLLLTFCGLVAFGIGAWRGYAAVRQALAPLVHDGEPTRSAIEGARPVQDRFRVRLFVHRVTGSVAWLIVALYGLYLLSVGASAQ
ncbi:MAG: hypothetical protein M3067_02755 [Chloroflexota bacterium]|nr:hypothetical protein [Chloroflexota bacterium]